MSLIAFNCRDMIEVQGHVGPRLYEIQGVHHGALDQESVVELMALDRSDPDAHGKKAQSMLVPMELLCAGIDAGIFEHTPANALG